MCYSQLLLTLVGLIAFGSGPTCLAQSPVSVVSSYLSKSRWEDRLAFVRQPWSARRLMMAHYGDKEIPLFDVKSLDPSSPDPETSVVRVLKSGQDSVYYVLKLEHGEWKIDWPASLNHNPLSAKDFSDLRPVQHYNMRVVAKLSNYYNYGFSKSKAKLLSVQLSSPNDTFSIDGSGPALPFGYIERDSLEGKKVYAALADGSNHALILKISYKPGTRGEVALIHKLVSSSWVSNETALIDQVSRDPSLDLTALRQSAAVECGELVRDQAFGKSCAHAGGKSAERHCSCSYIDLPEKLLSLCKRANEPSIRPCSESASNREEYFACINAGLRVRLKVVFDDIVEDCGK